MLYPQENKIRGIIDLNGVWDFALGTTEKPGDAVTLPEQMEPIAVPASYNDQKDDIDRKSTRLNSSHYQQSRMPSSA